MMENMILADKWNGLQRLNKEWYDHHIAVLYKTNIEDFDKDGIIALLEMIDENLIYYPLDLAKQIMETLLLLRISPDDNEKAEKTDFLLELMVRFQQELGSELDAKTDWVAINEIKQHWEETYQEAIVFLKKRINRKSNPSSYDLSKIPQQVPWTVEDFITKLDLE